MYTLHKKSKHYTETNKIQKESGHPCFHLNTNFFTVHALVCMYVRCIYATKIFNLR